MVESFQSFPDGPATPLVVEAHAFHAAGQFARRDEVVDGMSNQ